MIDDIANTDIEQVWGKLSEISCRDMLYPIRNILPRLHDKIDGFTIRFRPLYSRFLFGTLFFSAFILYIIVQLEPPEGFWAYHPLKVLFVGALLLWVCSGLMRVPMAEVCWQGLDTIIRQRNGFKTWELRVPADDLTVIFDVATESESWPKEWLGKGMILLQHKDFPDKPIVVTISHGKELWTLCNALSQKRSLTIEDKTSEPLELPYGRAINVCREALAEGYSNFKDSRLCVIQNDIAQVLPTGLSRWFFAPLALIGLFAIGVIVHASCYINENTGWGDYYYEFAAVIVISAFFVIGGIIGLLAGLYNRGVTFDRKNETVLIRWWLWTLFKKRSAYAFRDIAAVQLCTHYVNADDESPGFKATELNLVLANPPGERIVLMCHNQEVDIRNNAQMLAEFLDKPLLDHTQTRSALSSIPSGTT